MLAAARLVTAQNSSFDVFDFIDPLVGTSDGGECKLRAWRRGR